MYELWPVDETLLALTTEQWHIWRAWEKRFYARQASSETHPLLKGQNHRYAELQALIEQRLKTRGAPMYRALAKFRPREDQSESPSGSRLDMEVEWTNVP